MIFFEGTDCKSALSGFILAGYYNFEKVVTSIKQKISIESPIQMDIIEFKNWDRHLTMTYDSETKKIEIVNG